MTSILQNITIPYSTGKKTGHRRFKIASRLIFDLFNVPRGTKLNISANFVCGLETRSEILFLESTVAEATDSRYGFTTSGFNGVELKNSMSEDVLSYFLIV